MNEVLFPSSRKDLNFLTQPFKTKPRKILKNAKQQTKFPADSYFLLKSQIVLETTKQQIREEIDSDIRR